MSRRAAHSKDPWKRSHGIIADQHGNYITHDGRAGEVVCRMDGSTAMAFAREANMRLIEKAPELRRIVVNVSEGKMCWTADDMAKINALLDYIDKGDKP